MKRTFSITNKEVNEILDEATERNQASKLVETAILYYKKNSKEGCITKSELKWLILEIIKSITSMQLPISGVNHIGSQNELNDDIEDILGL